MQKIIMKKNLSNREIEILKLIADEKTSLQISKELKLSKRTVDRHRYNICKKIGLSGNNSLIQYSLKNRDSIFKMRLNEELLLNIDLKNKHIL